MNFRLFSLLTGLLTIPVFSIAQSLNNPLEGINNSLQTIVKDLVLYAMLIAILTTLIVYLIKKSLTNGVIGFGFLSLIFLIIWLFI